MPGCRVLYLKTDVFVVGWRRALRSEWPFALHPTHCSHGNVPTPTPATLMETPSVKTGKQNIIVSLYIILTLKVMIVFVGPRSFVGACPQ